MTESKEYTKLYYTFNDNTISEDEFINQLCNFLRYKNGNIMDNCRELLSIISKAIEYSFALDNKIQEDELHNGILTILEISPMIDDIPHTILVYYDTIKKICSLELHTSRSHYSMNIEFNNDTNDFQNCYEFYRTLSYIYENKVFIRKSYKYEIDKFKSQF